GIQMNADGETVCVGSTVSGNTVELCGLSGIWLSDCKNYAVSGNTVSECASHGVWLTNSVGGTVGSNTVTANGADGIRLDTCDDVAITGNTSRGNTGDGIQINVATYCTVTGNRCQGNATPFVESGASDYNMIAANNLLGNMSNACAVVGAHTQWSTGINGGTPNVASAATITLPKYTNYIVVTGVTNITSITAEPRDRMVTLRFSDILTVTDGGNLRLNGDLVTSASTTLTLQSSGANWWEIARCAT
ncbi:MAG: NosD domain-containing protein, partial [Candidatus Neomarinimicrobiota bacterium]